MLLAVDLDGSHRVAADDMAFPNGMVITPDGSTLIVGESFGGRLTAFTIGADGALGDRRVWADLGGGGGSPTASASTRRAACGSRHPEPASACACAKGGEIAATVSTGDQLAIACMLGDDDRRTLYILTSKGLDPLKARSCAPAASSESASTCRAQDCRSLAEWPSTSPLATTSASCSSTSSTSTALSKLPAFEHADLDTVYGLLEEYGRFVEDVIAPLDRGGDVEGATFDPRPAPVVTAPGSAGRTDGTSTPAGAACRSSPSYGGGGFPWLVGIVMQEFITARQHGVLAVPAAHPGRHRHARAPRQRGAAGALPADRW